MTTTKMESIEQIRRELAENPDARLTREQAFMLLEYVEAAEAQRRSSKFEGYELARARLESARRKLGLE